MGIIRKIICGILVALSAHIYTLPAYVSDKAEGLVRFTDYYAENDWYAEDNGTWNLYDDADLILFDNFTAENPYDDVIVSMRKVTYNTTFEMRGVTK